MRSFAIEEPGSPVPALYATLLRPDMSIIAVQGFGFAAKKHMHTMHRTNCKVVTVIVDVKLVQGVESLLLWL